MPVAGTIIKVLLIEDDEDDVLLVRKFLAQSEYYKFEITWEPNGQKGKERMLHENFDVFLLDYRLGAENGLELVKYANSQGVLTPTILLTGQGDLKVDLDASKYGASDYLVKSGLDASLLERSIRYAITKSRVIRELDEKEKKYSSLFQHSVDSIFLATEDFKLLNLNNSFLRFFGYPENEEVKELFLQDIFNDPSDYEHVLHALKAEEQIRDFEVLLINKEGKKKWCLMNCVFIPDQASDFCCYQGIIHDITLRKKAEKELLETERLTLTGKMARTIAHEIRNPLTNLNLAIENIKDDYAGDKNDDLKEYTEIIERNAHRIEELIGELLNSSKPQELNLELNDLNQVIEETLLLAMDRISLNNIHVEKKYATEIPRVLLDKQRIKTALLNIIINAIEALTGETKALSIHTFHQENQIVLHIEDTGNGIEPEKIENLFDPFYTAKPNGLGLGLTTTKNILNSHSAEVHVTSTVGEGTLFAIHFPLPY